MRWLRWLVLAENILRFIRQQAEAQEGVMTEALPAGDNEALPTGDNERWAAECMKVLLNKEQQL